MEEAVSVGWGVTMLIGCVTVQVAMGASIGQRVAQATEMAV